MCRSPDPRRDRWRAMLRVRRLQRAGDAMGCARELMRVGAMTEQIAMEDDMKTHRSAVTGKFVSPEVAAADPERHIAQEIHRAPELRIERMNPHFLKIHLSDGRVLHHFSGCDGPDADYHDHPFDADIRIMSGGYVEQVLSLDGAVSEIERHDGDSFRNAAGTIHRIIRLTAPFVLTEFRPGPHEREPGFYQPRPDGIWHRLWHEAEWRPV